MLTHSIFNRKTIHRHKKEGKGIMSEIKPLKNIELKLIAELMINSRRSDRELARAIGVSQPTVTRLRTKLEKERTIREYTAIPDFERLGYQIAAFTFLKLKTGISQERLEKERKRATEYMKNPPPEIVLFERGLGGPYQAIEVTFHRDYASFMRLKERVRQQGIFDDSRTMTFMIDLEDTVHYRYLTLSTLAKDFAQGEPQTKA
jgi:DNA-binding Lrp family transcriptional regulator